ncbi:MULTISPECIES: hypothetical protein [unclassified Sphingobacterium]|uniref:hypothetical protein n=1 Tax=unclassified Sphingobacterium TaxID=2609468 RepID=UPI0025FFA290|nr:MULTISPECIES: hypothetical protein [unclassified Sphingobacterium]
MGTTVNLNNDEQIIDTSRDTVIIVDNFQSVRGGRALEVTGYTPKVIYAGHVIIKDTATGNIYKPMPVNTDATAYAALPAGYEYAHILINSILTAKPAAGLLVRGTVNHKACYIEPTAEAMEALKPLIDFRAD